MMRYGCAVLGFALALISAASGNLAAVQPQKKSSSPSTHQALINQYCVTCHNQRAKTAGVMFDTMDLSDVSKNAEIWEKAVRKLGGGMMPPPGARRPDHPTAHAFVSSLVDSLHPPSPPHLNTSPYL